MVTIFAAEVVDWGASEDKYVLKKKRLRIREATKHDHNPAARVPKVQTA